MEVFKDMLLFIIERKKYWLAPVIFIFFIAGFLIFATSNTYVSAFIYSLF